MADLGGGLRGLYPSLVNQTLWSQGRKNGNGAGLRWGVCGTTRSSINVSTPGQFRCWPQQGGGIPIYSVSDLHPKSQQSTRNILHSQWSSHYISLIYTVKIVKVKQNFRDKTHNHKINAMPWQEIFGQTLTEDEDVQNISECHPLTQEWSSSDDKIHACMECAAVANLRPPLQQGQNIIP